MNFNLNDNIPQSFHPSSRVWIYQANRLFTLSEVFEIESILANFIQSWNSHGVPVKGYANLFFGQFVVLMADETATGVSGCSTDSSVRVIRQIEQRFGVNMFDRQMLAFLIKDKIQLLPLSQFNYAVENNFIDEESIYFNNLVQTKQELLDQWLIPVKASKLAGRITKKQTV
ncbi:MAG TPA: hypothetical protein PKM63_14685 [Panacibacter sp.]|nr:hypothetical protein [Panacibacter sp.]HNP45535.1 hypothetical protein [Panacibacter sp.]